MEPLQDLSEDQIVKLFHHYINTPSPHEYQWAFIATDVGTTIELVTQFYRNQRQEEDHVQEESVGTKSYDKGDEEKELRYNSIDSLSDKELSDLYGILENDPRPSRETISEIALVFGLDEQELAAFADGFAHGREQALLNDREVEVDSENEMGESSSQQGEAPKKRTPRMGLYRQTRPIRRSPITRTIAELSDAELGRLYNHLHQTPIPTQSDLDRISEDMRVTVKEIGEFYEMQVSTGAGSQSPDRVENEEVSESRDNRQNVFEREDPPPMLRTVEHLSNLELARLREIFKRNPNPSADQLRRYAADFGLYADELEGWFHSERIEISTQQVMAKRRAKRTWVKGDEKEGFEDSNLKTSEESCLLSEDAEKVEGSGPLEYHPPQKCAVTNATYSENLRQYFQTYRDVSNQESEEKATEEAELLKVKEQYQEKTQRRQTQKQMTENGEGTSTHTDDVSAENNASEDASQNVQATDDNAMSGYEQVCEADPEKELEEEMKENAELEENGIDEEESRTAEDKEFDNIKFDD